ncbi:MAG: ParB N-terminal domain-containing protein [Silvibacterium sp.]
MKFHPVCELFPTLNDEELRELAEDIRQNGQIHPILTHDNFIIDGKNRYLACELAGVPPKIEEWKPASENQSMVTFVISLNAKRRHLTSKDRAIIAVESLPLYEAEAAERQKAGQKQGGETAGSGRPKENSSPQKIGESYSDSSPESPATPKTKKPKSHEGEAVAQAAKAAGTNRESVRQAKKMKKEQPERYEQAKRNIGKKRVPKQPKPKQEKTPEMEAHIRNRLFAVKFAQLNRPVTHEVIEREMNLSPRNVDNFISGCKHFDWLTLDQPKGCAGYVFVINQRVKDVCDDACDSDKADARLGGISRLEFAVNLLYDIFKDIDDTQRDGEERQRKHNFTATQRNWNPDHINKGMLIDVIRTYSECHSRILAKRELLSFLYGTASPLPDPGFSRDTAQPQRPN